MSDKDDRRILMKNHARGSILENGDVRSIFTFQQELCRLIAENDPASLYRASGFALSGLGLRPHKSPDRSQGQVPQISQNGKKTYNYC
jgi:hypothetical protein